MSRIRINQKNGIQLGTGQTSNPAFRAALEAFLATLKAR